ncbi:hypothetical protein PQE74_gp205 [Bacillus phage vB_BanS_Chewbecca]|uniref:Uncharacterized protein n=1 Tax=Bacillus phage vB_BanS_Chewbecca TaxID=2894786 RepID=A0AAE8YRE6_9CAUD|nr:hypothetical protein PQE74_gp205 [Bacillus phage vB_BanS_Chewbecca]UGO46288.1 hypothetical protein CHEWBECCA_205 [Bacillus phage vB_BanS_Chewbecca]
MKMNQEERREMMSYLDLLVKMDAEGFACKKEISEALKVVHAGFGFTEEAKSKYQRSELRKILRDEIANSELVNGIANQGKLIRVTELERQIGKTLLLIDFALAYDLPILVGNDSLVNYTKTLARESYGKDSEKLSILIGRPHEVMGRKLPNGVLVDCSVRFEDYLEIKKYTRIRGGFHHDKLFI